MSFNIEKNCFKRLKDKMDNTAKAEYESGVKLAITRYNTTLRENRFIVGGIVEIFTLALMRSAGIEIEACGKEAVRGDLKLPGGEMFSLKTSFTERSNITLINKMGDSDRTWQTATLFVLANRGIIYGDPTMIMEDDLSQSGDRLDIKRRALNRFSQDPSNLIEMNIPLKPPLEKNSSDDIESIAIAIELMNELKMVKLLSHITESWTAR